MNNEQQQQDFRKECQHEYSTDVRGMYCWKCYEPYRGEQQQQPSNSDKIKTDMAMDRIGRKLCKYLQEQYSLGHTEFRVAMQSKTHFIIHVPNVDSKTIDIDWSINNGESYSHNLK